MKIKLSELSSNELNNLLVDIDSLLAKQGQIDALCDKVRQECAELGIDASVIAKALGAPKTKPGPGKLGAAPAVFQNSDGKTWSARGIMPGWLKELIAQGKDIAQYYVGPSYKKEMYLNKYK